MMHHPGVILLMKPQAGIILPSARIILPSSCHHPSQPACPVIIHRGFSSAIGPHHPAIIPPSSCLASTPCHHPSARIIMPSSRQPWKEKDSFLDSNVMSISIVICCLSLTQDDFYCLPLIFIDARSCVSFILDDANCFSLIDFHWFSCFHGFYILVVFIESLMCNDVHMVWPICVVASVFCGHPGIILPRL